MGEIVDLVAQFIERFVFLKDRRLYRLIALWVILTHRYLTFDYTGYLFFHSPEPESGKSRALEVLHTLVYNSSGLLVSPTEAVLFRTANDSTQLLDEVDSWSNRDELRSVLNQGYHIAGTVTRMEPIKKGYRAVKFPVFAPRALAGVGLHILDRTTKDRTFSIEMVRQTKGEKREKFRLRKLGPEIEELRNLIEVFWITREEKVIELYERDRSYLQAFRDRTEDIAEPLAAILEAAYEGEPEMEKVRDSFLEAIAVTRDDQQEEITEHRILRHLMDLAKGNGELIGNATELAEKCSNLPEAPGKYLLSATLRKYGFINKSIRRDGISKYRYALSYHKLADIVSRYASSNHESDGEAVGG